jgi:hypothetical protein
MVNKPLRLMGAKSTDVEGQVLYFEYGTFTVNDNETTGEISTGLTNIVWAGFFPKTTQAITAAPYSTLIITTGTITVLTTDPGGDAVFAYLLIGTVETP